MKTVIIKKISASKNPEYPTEGADNYKYGKLNPLKSPPVDYTIEGRLLEEIKVGECVKVARSKRNDVVCMGYFETSPVVSKTEDGFETCNSIYTVQYLSA